MLSHVTDVVTDKHQFASSQRFLALDRFPWPFITVENLFVELHFFPSLRSDCQQITETVRSPPSLFSHNCLKADLLQQLKLTETFDN